MYVCMYLSNTWVSMYVHNYIYPCLSTVGMMVYLVAVLFFSSDLILEGKNGGITWFGVG